MIVVWVVLGLVLLFGLTAFIGAPYVPSHRSALRKAFSELRPVGADDLVVDIGSGDGVVLGIVAKRGAKGLGIEINPVLVAISWLATRRFSGRVKIRLGDLWQAKFPEQTTVVYAFGESRDIKRMYAKVQNESNRLGRSIDFMSYGFSVPEHEPAKTGHGFYLYRLNPLQ